MMNQFKQILVHARIALLAAGVLVGYAVKGQTVIYIAPEGSDAANGSAQHPVATLEAAIRMLEKRPAADSLTLQLAGGTYRLSTPLVLDDTSPIARWKQVEIRAADGQQAIVSGNRLMEGKWQAAGNNLWKCSVEGVFNQLFVDGKRATRSRYPNAGEWLEPDSINFGKHELYFQGKLPAAFEKIKGAELHATGMWHWNRQYIERFDSKGQRVVTVTYPGTEASYTKIGKRDRVHFENAKAFLDTEGEWYLDREKRLLYYFSKERPDDKVFEYPVLTELFRLSGSGSQQISDFSFNGITFEGTEWDMTAVERKGLQAGFWGTGRTDSVYAPPAALSLAWVTNSRITNCTFRNLGEGAVSFGDGCAYNAIEGNRFEDIGSNVIQIGYRRAYLGKGHPLHLDFEDAALVSHHNLIRNNVLDHFGTTDRGAVGIWIGYSHNNRIDYNQITNFPYAGINVGWYWGTDTTLVATHCHHNTIAWNDISKGMRYLSDGAGIYLVGNQPGTVIHDNFVHQIGGGFTITSGIYVDEGGANMTITGNYFDALDNPNEAHAIKLHKNAIPTMEIYNNGGEYRVHPIHTNPVYQYGKYAEVRLTKPPFPQRYGVQLK